jgi:hypothetical protein
MVSVKGHTKRAEVAVVVKGRSEGDGRAVLLKNVPHTEVSNTMLYRTFIRFGSIK